MSNKQSGNVVLWIVLGLVAIGLAVAIVWRYFAATDALNDADQATQNSEVKKSDATLNIKEYGLKLSYDSAAGPVTYTIVDQDLTTASGETVKSKAIKLENASLANAVDGCGSEAQPSYAQLGAISVQKQLDTGEFAPTSYVKTGDNYLVYNYSKTNITVDDPCYDKTLETKSTAQKQSLLDSFNKQSTKNTAQNQ